MKYTELAQDYFERHSTSDECHISSDGRVFHTFGYATSYVQEHDLKSQEIESYKRSDVEEFTDNPFVIEMRGKLSQKYEALFGKLPSEELDNEDLESLVSQEEARLIKEKDDAEILEKFKNTDIENEDYNDLKAFAKHFKIETEDQKAATLKTALIDFKNTLNTAE